MKRKLYTALGISIFATTAAFAGDGYVTGNVNLRAGPDSSYPSVAMLGAGTEVAIEGCVDGWSWCDVASGDERGWIAGNFLQEEYQGQRVLVPAYGVQIGIPIVSFMFGTYWDDHYRNQSWYGTRERWSHFSPQYRSVDAHHDAHTNTGDNFHGNSNHGPHDAQAADFHNGNQLPKSSPVAAQPTTQERPVASVIHSPEASSNRSKPEAVNAPKPVEITNAAAPNRTVTPQKAIVQRKIVTPAAAPPKATSEKVAPVRDSGKDKDKEQH